MDRVLAGLILFYLVMKQDARENDNLNVTGVRKIVSVKHVLLGEGKLSWCASILQANTIHNVD